MQTGRINLFDNNLFVCLFVCLFVGVVPGCAASRERQVSQALIIVTRQKVTGVGLQVGMG